MSSPPNPPPPTANLFQKIDYVVKGVIFLIEEALNTEHELEHIVSQNEDLTAVVAELNSSVAELGMRLTSEMADLAAAIAAQGQPSPEVDAAITALRETVAQVAGYNVSLASDDAPVPA